jgi:methylthioribose-1-phosphate isomerase
MDMHIRFDPAQNALILLDQKALPLEETYVACKTEDEVAARIKDLTVRGAPAIGVAAGWGGPLLPRLKRRFP